MKILSPSILSANLLELGLEIEKIEKGGAQYIHIDVMDGMFVPNISFGMPIIKAANEKSDLILDVHLMIEEPDRYVEEVSKAGADIICVHVEACKHLQRTLAHIKECGCKAAVALNPGTPLNCLEYILDDVEMILIMSVNPGFGGQKLLSSSLDKVKNLKKMLQDQKKEHIKIEIDGGVKLDNVKQVMDAGVDVVVAGSAVFGNDTLGNTKKFVEIMK